MNRQELIWVAMVAGLALLGHFTSTVVLKRTATWLQPRLKPLLDRMFPSLKMEPWLFEPIAADQLPPDQHCFFETHTPAFIARGFTHLGDFVLRRDPVAWNWQLAIGRSHWQGSVASSNSKNDRLSCVRYFLSRDHTVIGGLSCYLGHQVIDCLSVLLDGFYLESASHDCPQPPPAEHGLQFFPFPTNDAVALIDHHIARAAQVASTRGVSPAPLTPADLQAAVNHGRQLSLRSLHHQGFLDELPDFLRDKTTTAASA
jgi:hypothetical protein